MPWVVRMLSGWNCTPKTGRVAFSVDLGAPIADLALTASSVLAGVGREVRLVNGLAGRAQPPLVLDADVRALAVSHDGSAYVALDMSGQLVVVRTLTGRRTFAARVDGASCVAFSPDDRTLRVGGEDGTIHEVALAGAPTSSVPPTSAAPAHVLRLRDRATLRGDQVLDASHTPLAHGVTTFDALGDVVLIGGPTGWSIVGEGSVASPSVVDLALHPGLTHAVIATVEGSVDLVALPE